MSLKHLRFSLSAAAVAALLWALWLGWDTGYDIDPLTGNSSGPYEPWQVLGLAASVSAQAVWFRTRMRPGLAAASMTAGITAAAAFSFSQDDSGLAAIGVALIFLGSLTGISAVLAGAQLLSSPKRPSATPLRMESCNRPTHHSPVGQPPLKDQR